MGRESELNCSCKVANRRSNDRSTVVGPMSRRSERKASKYDRDLLTIALPRPQQTGRTLSVRRPYYWLHSLCGVLKAELDAYPPQTATITSSDTLPSATQHEPEHRSSRALAGHVPAHRAVRDRQAQGIGYPHALVRFWQCERGRICNLYISYEVSGNPKGNPGNH